MGTIFVSYTGTQIMGTLTPLLGSVHGGQRPDAIWLYVSKLSVPYAERIRTFCEEHALPPVTLLPEAAPADIVKDVASRGEHMLFNCQGGQNFRVAQMVAELATREATLVLTTSEEILFVPTAGGDTLRRPLPPALPVRDMLALQNVVWEQEQGESPFCAFCRAERIPLPHDMLQNIRVGGLMFDAVWCGSGSHVSFLVDTTANTSAKSKIRLRNARAIAHWAASREASGQLFSRMVHVLCPSGTIRDHVRDESRHKAHAVVINAQLPRHRRMEKLRTIMTRLTTAARVVPYAAPAVCPVGSDTLVLMLGDDVAPTLNAIVNHKLPHVILCHTADERQRERAQRLASNMNHLPGVEHISLLATDITGCTLPHSLIPENGAHNIHVNITPGTKGHSAFLTLWARRHGFGVWSLDKSAVRMLAPDKNALPVLSCDPLLLLRQSHPAARACDMTSRRELFDALLHQMRACLEEGKEWLQQEVHAGGYSKEWLETEGKWRITTPAGKRFLYAEAGGEWLEGLTAYAFRQAGATHVHERVRIPWEHAAERQLHQCAFRMDMDVIGAWKSVHFLVSCKATTKQTKKPAAEECVQMAQSLSRFALPLLCHLGVAQWRVETMCDSRATVAYFGWRELCRPECLRMMLDELLTGRQHSRAASSESKISSKETA